MTKPTMRALPRPRQRSTPPDHANKPSDATYGPHLLGDLPDCNPRLMCDGEFIYRFLLDLVRVAGMSPMGSPHLDLYTGPFKEWEGFSATVHIQTSHVTAHFFAFGYVFIDVFSCRQFDRAKVKDFIARSLETTGKVRWRELRRGVRFPNELTEASYHPARRAAGA